MGLGVDEMCLHCNKKALVCCLTCKKRFCIFCFVLNCFCSSGNIVTTDGLGLTKNEKSV